MVSQCSDKSLPNITKIVKTNLISGVIAISKNIGESNKTFLCKIWIEVVRNPKIGGDSIVCSPISVAKLILCEVITDLFLKERNVNQQVCKPYSIVAIFRASR